jgi:hypothetical protein
MHIFNIMVGEGHFLYGLFFQMLYVTLILSSNVPGDISSCPLLLRITTILWRESVLVPKFCGWVPHKSSHPFSLSPSLPPSPLRQLWCLLGFDCRKLLNSNGKAKRNSNKKGKVVLKARQTVAVKSCHLGGARASLFIGEVKGLITIP